MNVAGFLRFSSVESVSGWSVSGRRVGIFQASLLSSVFPSLPTTRLLLCIFSPSQLMLRFMSVARQKPNIGRPVIAVQKFFLEIESDSRDAAAERTAVACAGYDPRKTWCDPSLFNEIVGVDFGGGMMYLHFLNEGSDKGPVDPLDGLAILLNLPGRTLVVAESAHIATPQTERSLSQPFTADQLTSLYSGLKASGNCLGIFPHQHSRKAREWSAANAPNGFVDRDKSDDANDARALAYYVAKCNGVSMRKPSTSFEISSARLYGAMIRRVSNVALAAIKVDRHSGKKFPLLTKFGSRLVNSLDRSCDFVSDKVAVSIVALVVCERDGQLFRFLYNGRVPGFNFWKDNVMKFTAFHHKAGIARANLCRDRFRPYLAEFAAARDVRVKDGARYMRHADLPVDAQHIRQQAWAHVRRDVRAAYRMAVEMSAGFPGLEVLSDIQEDGNA
jgi:hypothetical protein